MRNTIFLSLILSALGLGVIQAQVMNQGAVINIGNGAGIYCQGDFRNESGEVQQAGQIQVEGDLVNLDDWDMSPQSELVLRGITDSELATGSTPIGRLVVAKTNQAQVRMIGDVELTDNLTFTHGGSHLDVLHSQLHLASTATITGADAQKFIITSGTGKVSKDAVNDFGFTFPIGNAPDHYQPITVVQDDVAERIAVRCLAETLTSGDVGAPLIHGVVKGSWEVSESVPGNNQLTLTTEWSVATELPGLDRNRLGLSHWDGTNWTLMWSEVQAAVSQPGGFALVQGEATEVGIFAVGGAPVAYPLRMSIQAYLQGAIQGTAMRDDLRQRADFPLMEPYSDLGFIQEKFGGQEQTTIGQLADFGNDSNVVDWLLLELRDAADPSEIVATKTLLIRQDGQLIDEYGSTNFAVSALPAGDYYVALRHRNHLGICTASPVALSHAHTSLNFTDGSLSLYGANPVYVTNTGLQAMRAGDANGDGRIRYNGSGNDRNTLLFSAGLFTPNNIVEGYDRADVNLDGKVRYNGSGNDRNTILFNVGLLTPNETIFEQIPQ